MSHSDSRSFPGISTQKVVIATTVMLSFISFWRAAAIVLSDLASSAYYVGGIAEGAVGKSAPWFILAIMLFSYAVRAIYVESCSMFVRGGVYKVVHEAMGGVMAKFSVSALLFDYVLTGPISGVSAGLYIAGLFNDLHPGGRTVNPNTFAALFAVAVTVYFWRSNIIGIHESSHKALRIMQITTVMVVILIAWCLVTIFHGGYQPVPLPFPAANLGLSEESLGWLHGTLAPHVTWIVVLIGLGHSLLAMSGEESLAQVHREIAHPKLKNLKRAGLVIFAYSLIFTSLVSFFAVMLIPDAERTGTYKDNLIGGLAMHLAGPLALRLVFHGFVVVVGAMLLSGAVNTAIIGSNGVLNRVAEDGVLTGWFRRPHAKYGTTYRIIHLIAFLQIVCITISYGDVDMLGGLYAFGVAWSFAMLALSMLVLRFKKPAGREWRVPFNVRIGNTDFPVGLAVIATGLVSLALINMLTKPEATVAGVCFTAGAFCVFELSERYNRRLGQVGRSEDEQFRLDTPEELSLASVRVRPGCVLAAVRNPIKMEHLARVLQKTDTRRQDVVVLSVSDPEAAFSSSETTLFSQVVTMAEKAGKHVELVNVTGADPYRAIVEAASVLKASRIVTGHSPTMSPEGQARAVGDAWEALPEPRPALSLEVWSPDRGQSSYFNLGPHPPRLWPEDVDLVHRLWLRLTADGNTALRHRDVVNLALGSLERELDREGKAR